MSMSSALKASLFAIVIVAMFTSLVVISEIDTADAESESGIEFNDGTLRYRTISIDTVEVAGPVKHGVSSLTIPPTVNNSGSEYKVTSLGEWAFMFCINLTSVTIPNSVTSIGEGAFASCTGLTSITIPNSVTSIGDWAFGECSGLTSVTIPDNVKFIGEGAFVFCNNLTSINVSEGNNSFSNDMYGVLYNKNKTKIIQYPGGSEGSFEIPYGVTSIGIGAFGHCVGLTSITIPNSVTSICEGAFTYCTGLTSVTIPGNVKFIGDWAFDGCTGLTSITIPKSVTSIGEGAFREITFYSEDNEILEQNISNLAGYTFAGTYEKMVSGYYAVNYDVVGGSHSAPEQTPLKEGESFSIESYKGTKTGYNFGGWTDGSEVYVVGSEYTIESANVTLTAIWNAIQYTVTFDSADGNAIEPITKDYGTEVELPTEVTKAGYKFAGWSLTKDGEAIKTLVLEKDVALYALWKVAVYDELPSKEDIVKIISQKDEPQLQMTEKAKDEILDNSLFESLRGKPLTIDVVDDKEQVKYSWTFKGEYNSNAGTFKAGISQMDPEGDLRNALTKKGAENPLVLKFAASGELPIDAAVKYYVGENYEDGTELTLFYYKADTKQLEEKAKDIVVTEGWVTLSITHCSSYILTDEIVPVSDSEDNTLLYLGIGISALILVAVAFFIMRRQ